jgi:hypothetical protein
MRVGIHYGQYGKRVHGEDGPYDVVVETFHIEAVDEDGHVWALDKSHTENEEEAKRELWFLEHNPNTRPEAWVECSPVYGSNAWDDEAEYELACFEADAYNEPRPHW